MRALLDQDYGHRKRGLGRELPYEGTSLWAGEALNGAGCGRVRVRLGAPGAPLISGVHWVHRIRGSHTSARWDSDPARHTPAHTCTPAPPTHACTRRADVALAPSGESPQPAYPLLRPCPTPTPSPSPSPTPTPTPGPGSDARYLACKMSAYHGTVAFRLKLRPSGT